jgi:truncated hemoglobin YjbI
VSKFRIDDSNLFEELGAAKLIELSTAFYQRIHADPDPAFRAMFPEDLADAVQNQYEFFIQRLGGPNLYSQRKGHPALRMRHKHFSITKDFAAKWLAHMSLALDDVGISGDTRDRLWEFFEETAFFLQNVGEGGERIY